MQIRIFRVQRNLRESWLAVNDDGTVTYHLRNFGSRLIRDGAEERSRSMSAAEAKLRWPLYAKSIELAVAEVIARRPVADVTPDRAEVRPSKRKHLLGRYLASTKAIARETAPVESGEGFAR
jgi:hypothetical protein